MGTKSILLAVAEAQTTTEIVKALGAEWDAVSAVSAAEAEGQLETRPFDALLVDFNFGESDGSDLLNHALEKHPDTVRFLLAYEADLALVAAKIEGTPQILPKPVEAASLKGRIEEGVDDSKSESAGVVAAAPPVDAPVPAIYSLVLKALESPVVTHKQVGAIIARDEALSSELLSLTRSSYLGVQSNFTQAAQAVESLGLDTVKAIVMALQFLAENSAVKPAYLSLDQIWQHGINVGQIARDLVLFETKDRALASQALVAGLIHDLGKVVLAKNFDDLYGRVHSLARKQPVAIWDIEKEMFGANHGEIGGCLVGMWNMPGAVVEAVALHHEPPADEHDEMTPLAAVHIANVLERELWLGDEDMKVAPVVNAHFLNHLGLLQRLPVWRAAFANRKAVCLDPDLTAAKAAETDTTAFLNESLTVNELAGEVTGPQTVTSGRRRNNNSAARPRSYRRHWVFAGAAALMLLVLWFGTHPGLNQSEPVYARTSVPEPSTVVSSTPSPVATPAPQVAPVVPAPEEPVPPPPPPAEVVSQPAAVEPAPKPEPAIVAAAPVTTVSLASVTPEPKPEPVFRVNGIFSSTRPTAIVNGKTVGLRDKVNGATVISIGPSTVTLDLNGKTITCELK